jgi:hypothetical protein
MSLSNYLRSSLFLFALPSPLVMGQIQQIGPFTGTSTEPFEGIAQSAPCLFGGPSHVVYDGAFQDQADLCAVAPDLLYVQPQWQAGCILLPHSGNQFAFSTGEADLVFDTLASRFGGYFTSSGGSTSGTATFYALDGTFIGAEAITLSSSCGSWTWGGWDAGAGPLFKRVHIASSLVGGGYLYMDDLQADILAPSYSATCFGDGTQGPCPCSNSGFPTHGCKNSALPYGARLDATGLVAPDTITLHAIYVMSAVGSNVLSITLQGDSQLALPVSFGDGLRCAGGHLLRLYSVSASNGGVNVPGPADPSISARSAALGDPLTSGSVRIYQVYYRDPLLAFCPAPQGNSWNVTNAISVTW